MDPRLSQPSLAGPYRPENPVAAPPLEPPPAPSRAGKPLAAAVAKYREAVDTLARLDLADNKGQKALWRANDVVEASTQALAEAQERAEAATYAKLTGTRAPAGPTVPQAERDAADAEAKRDALLRARERIQFERQRAENALATTRAVLTEAVADHIRQSPEANALAATYLTALRQLNTIRAVFCELPHGALPPSVAGYATSNFADRFPADPALAATWRQAVAALETDPAAPLPKSSSARASGGVGQRAVSTQSRRKQHPQRSDGSSPSLAAGPGAPM